MAADDSALWLVKSSGRILGPFTITDILVNLRSREIALHDEACQPLRRWHMIRDHKALAPLLDALQGENSSPDDVTTNVEQLTASLTESLHGTSSDEITADIGEFQSKLTEIVYESLPESATASRAGNSARFQVATAIDERGIKSRAEKSSRLMWLLTLSILLAVSGGLFFKRQQNVKPDTAKPVGQIVKEAQGAFADGDWRMAMTKFQQVMTQEPTRREAWLPQALMLIQVEGQTVQGRRLLTQMIDSKMDLGPGGWTTLGLAEAADQNWAKAEENFRRALEVDGTFEPALANLASLALQSGQYAAAKQQFQALLETGAQDGVILLQLVQASVIESPTEEMKLKWAELDHRITDFAHRTFDYQQEFQLAGLYLKLLSGQADWAGGLTRALDIDPRQTDDHRHDLLYLRNSVSWSALGEWCEKVVQALGDAKYAAALNATCLLRQGQDQAAKDMIEKAVSQNPKDPLVQALYAQVLRGAGFVGESSVALGRAIEFDRKGDFFLPLILQARFCQEQGDWDCAHTYWLKVLERNSSLPAAKVGMAMVHVGRGAVEPARRELRDIATPSNYRPFLLLRRSIGGPNGG